jgi:hypothetical protein
MRKLVRDGSRGQVDHLHCEDAQRENGSYL